MPVSGRRLLAVGALGVLMAAVAGALGLLAGSAFQHAVGWIGAAFFGACALVALWQGFTPGGRGLRLRREGFAVVGWRRTRRYAWADVASFQVVQMTSTSRFVGFTLKDEVGRTRLMNVNRAAAGSDGTLPTALAAPVEDLAAMMESWRVYYTGSSPFDT